MTWQPRGRTLRARSHRPGTAGLFHATLWARVLACLLLAVCAASAQAGAPQSLALPRETAVSAGFSPDGSALALVLQVIGQAHRSIDVAAYLLTSSDVARALVQAQRRGVRVRVLLDAKSDMAEDARYARHALGILVNAGIAVRSIDAYPLFHDKYMIIDRRTVQTGSFNYTSSAARRNAENVLVVWNAPQLAARYQADWERNWALGRAVQLPY